jgi:hypothetical protein
VKPLRDVAGKELSLRMRWLWLRRAELWARDEVVMQWSWRRLSREAVAEGGDGEWHMARRGWLRGVIVLSSAPGGEPVAETRLRLGGRADIHAIDDGTFTWRGEGYLVRSRVLRDAAGSELIRCRPALWLPPKFHVEISPSAWGRPELPALVAQVGFLLQRMVQRAVTAAG